MQIEIGLMRESEADALYELVARVSEQMVCPDFEPEGRAEFFEAVTVMMYERPTDHIVLVAREADRPVGLIDIRRGFYICLFFVDLPWQGRGIGRMLFEAAVKQCRIGEDIFMEVHSSLFAVPIYQSLGFEKKSDVIIRNGIRFVELDYGKP